VKGDSIPWVMQVEGKSVGGLGLPVSLTIKKERLVSLRDHRLLWIHSPNSRVSFYWEWEKQATVGRNIRPLYRVAHFIKKCSYMCLFMLIADAIVVQFTLSYIWLSLLAYEALYRPSFGVDNGERTVYP
jgi:hypothetical protein